MRFSIILAVMKKDFRVHATSIAMVFSVLIVGQSATFGIIVRITQNPFQFSLYRNMWPLTTALVIPLTFGLAALTLESTNKTVEMVLSTSLKPIEFLFAKWLFAFTFGIIGTYTAMVVFLTFTWKFYLSYSDLSSWLYPIVLTLATSSVSIATAVVQKIQSLSRKLLAYILLFGPAIAIYITQVVQKANPNIQSTTTTNVNAFVWLIVCGYSIFIFVLALKNLDVSNFIQ